MGEKKGEDKLKLLEPLHLSLITLDHPDLQSTVAAAFPLSSTVASSGSEPYREGDSGIYIFHLSVDINC